LDGNGGADRCRHGDWKAAGDVLGVEDGGMIAGAAIDGLAHLCVRVAFVIADIVRWDCRIVGRDADDDRVASSYRYWERRYAASAVHIALHECGSGGGSAASPAGRCASGDLDGADEHTIGEDIFGGGCTSAIERVGKIGRDASFRERTSRDFRVVPKTGNQNDLTSMNSRVLVLWLEVLSVAIRKSAKIMRQSISAQQRLWIPFFVSSSDGNWSEVPPRFRRRR
jgi:hypothetical protein